MSNREIPFWQDPKNRSLVFQAVAFVLVLGTAWYLFSNTQKNLERQNIASGFEFFSQEAGFEIGESLIEYDSASNYLSALKVGFLNTFKVAIIGNIFAVIIGIFLGILALSRNWLVRSLTKTYVEIFRNIPLLLQLFFWYAIFTEILPGVRQALSPAKGFFICNRGVFLTVMNEHPIWSWVIAAIFVGIVLTLFANRIGLRRQEKTGQEFPIFFWGVGLVVIFPIIVWLIGGAPTELSVPELRGFNFRGGYNLSPEFISLLLGLILYTGAFNAEIVRAGILSVKKGQWEAAESLGFSRLKSLRLVIFPQALRVIIPPLTSQILNLTKNSSLAVAIAYPDFVNVANTTLNQTGQAVEVVGLIMLVYLTFSLSTSFFMNWFNKRMALVER